MPDFVKAILEFEDDGAALTILQDSNLTENEAQ